MPVASENWLSHERDIIRKKDITIDIIILFSISSCKQVLLLPMIWQK